MFSEYRNWKIKWTSEQKELRQNESNCAFVYVHLEADTGNPFYVGVGVNETRPWFFNHHSRTEFHKNIVRKHGCCVHIVVDKVSFDVAKFWEKVWIKLLKQSEFRLVNLTEGGEGVLGYKHTKESLKKMSEVKIGKKGSRLGLSQNKETCDLISKKMQELWKNEEYSKKMSTAHKGQIVTTECRDKISKKMTSYRASETPEQKEARRLKQIESYSKKTTEEKFARIKKASETRRRNNLLKKGIA